MKTLLKVLTVLFGLGSIGQLIAGHFFPAGLILAVICGYFGWRETTEKK